MSPKQGRPFEEKGKKGRVEIRTSEVEERMLDFCVARTGTNRADIIRQGIAEIYHRLSNEFEDNYNDIVELKVAVTCPHCESNNRITVTDYERGRYSYDTGENRMGEQIEYDIECEAFECRACGKEFSFEGQVWEYPIGVLESKNIQCLPKK